MNLPDFFRRLPGLSKKGFRSTKRPRDLSYLADDSLKFERLYERIVNYMEGQRPYLNGSFSIGVLAGKLFETKAMISKTINRCSGKNFRGFVNAYRVKYAADLLKKDPGMKIEHAAGMSGFNTIPTFNSAFKNVMHERPSEYQAKARGRLWSSPLSSRDV